MTPAGVADLAISGRTAVRMDWQVIRQAHYEGIDVTVMRTFL
jgi:hypothetical protein